MPDRDAPIITSVPVEAREPITRRMKIFQDDVAKYGMTAGCPGCRSINRGTTVQSHSEACRRRILEEIKKAEREQAGWTAKLKE
jgi:hypothetical protein